MLNDLGNDDQYNEDVPDQDENNEEIDFDQLLGDAA